MSKRTPTSTKAKASPTRKPSPTKKVTQPTPPKQKALAKKTSAPQKATPIKKAPAKTAKATQNPSAKKSTSSKSTMAAPPTKPATKPKATVAKPTPKPHIEVLAESPPQPSPKVAPPKADTKPTKTGALYYDSHMHTPLCKHAWGEPDEYAEQGIQSGLKGITFTCHCPMPDGYWPSVRMADSEFDTYVDIVAKTTASYAGKLDVRLGIESEFFPGCEEWISKLHQRADFHYVLGAVHWQARDYLAKYETGTIENFRRTYFNHLAESAESGLYDCLAHPDLVKNYHPDSWCFAIIKNTVEAALDRIAKTGVAMEINTSGLNKSYSEMNPGLEMLRMMCDRDIPIVIGSDAHRPHRVGEHFMTALSHLQESGYTKVSYFAHRQRVELKIADVMASIKKAADAQVS